MLHIRTAAAALIDVFDVQQCIAGQKIMPVVKLQFVELRVHKQVMKLNLCCRCVFMLQMCMYGCSQAYS